MQTLLLAGGVVLAAVLGLLIYILIRVLIIEMFDTQDDSDEDD